MKANEGLIADIEEATMNLWANLSNGQVDGKEDLTRELVKQWGWHEWRGWMEHLDPKQRCVFEYRLSDGTTEFYIGTPVRKDAQEYWRLQNGTLFSSFNTVKWKRI